MHPPQKDDDPDAVLHDSQRNHRQREDRPCPRRPEVQVTRHQAHNEQRQGGPDAAAFLGNLDGEPRQREHEVLAEDRHAEQLEEHSAGLGRGSLEESDDGVQDERRKGHHEHHQEQSKRRLPKRVGPIAEDERSETCRHHGKDRKRPGGLFVEPQQARQPRHGDCHRHHERAEARTRLHVRKNCVSIQVDQEEADEGDRDDV